MKEFFFVANSNAAPFFSDTTTGFVKAETAKEALKKAVGEYQHSCGLYALYIHANANDYHKGKQYLARHLSKEAKKALKRSA
jgi:hypothetical protein